MGGERKKFQVGARSREKKTQRSFLLFSRLACVARKATSFARRARARSLTRRRSIACTRAKMRAFPFRPQHILGDVQRKLERDSGGVDRGK